jgi:hypothetical protein
MKESDIIHEAGRFWVCREPKPGLFKVCEIVGTHSVVRDTIHFPDNAVKARAMAVEKCDRRAVLS